jgi:SAM-dependent methyltransferase
MKDTPPVCDYEGSDYQSSFWEQGGRIYEDLAESIALSRLLPKEGKLLLEVGAGAGRNTHRYQGFERVVLLDYSRTQLQLAKERLGNGSRYIYVASDVYRMPFTPGLFDTATMIRVLHHMADATMALEQVRKTLRAGGTFVLEFANKHNLKAILRYALRQQPWSPYSRDPVEFAALNFDFHPKAVDDYLKKAGFSIDRKLTVSHFRMGIFKRTLPPGFLARLDSIAQLTGDLWQLSPSVFVRSTAVGEPVAAEPGSFFCCPNCGSSLEELASELCCNSCCSQWPIRDGIYDFTGKS